MRKASSFLLKTVFIQLFIYDTAFANENVVINDAWISEAPPTVSTLAGYVNIQNNSDATITLVSADSPDFSSIEIHRSIIKDGMALMEKQTSLTIAAGTNLKLIPGDYHLMLFNPDKPLRSGDTTTLNFSFANGHTQTVTATIKKRGSEDHSHHHH